MLWRPTKFRNPYNVKPFLTDISASVAQIQKFQKTRCIFFRILVLVGPSPPSQLVPNPFNWSPNTVFYRYLSIGRSNKKNKKQSTSLFKFCFWEDSPHPVNWSPTHSTGSQTLFFTDIYSKKALFGHFVLWTPPPSTPPPPWLGGGWLGEFTVCTVCIEKQKTTKNGQMAAGRVKMSERVN